MVARSEGDASGPEQTIEGERATIKALRNAGLASWVDTYWATLAVARYQ